MTDVNFIDGARKKEVYFLVKLSRWEWCKSETLDDDSAFYDFSPDGRLFDSSGDCPVCGCENGLHISASADGESVLLKDYMCLCCEESGDSVLFFCGEAELATREDGDDHFFSLPSHVVIEVA